jgi:hypothetical protein
MSFSKPTRRSGLAAALAAAAALLAGGAGFLAAGVLTPCGPFTDVEFVDPFCPFVLEIFRLGITTGTTPTTYAPNDIVTRLQMSAFLSRTVDTILRRGSPRTRANRHWNGQFAALGVTTVGTTPRLVTCDGTDMWVANFGSATVTRIRASDGRFLETWTSAGAAWEPIAAMGAIVVSGNTAPGRLYRIDPSAPSGDVTTVASTLGNSPAGIAFDGGRFWTANISGSVSIVTPQATLPWTVTTVTTGFVPLGALYDGSNVWVTDTSNSLRKLDSNGAVLQTVTLSAAPFNPVFDGTNIWVPSTVDRVFVVRGSSGTILATLTGNGLNTPTTAAFDGSRILVTNYVGNTVSFWKAADLTPLGTGLAPPASHPYGAASDGVGFWVSLENAGKIARF